MVMRTCICANMYICSSARMVMRTFICVQGNMYIVNFFSVYPHPCAHPHPHALSDFFVNICTASFCDTTVDDVY